MCSGKDSDNDLQTELRPVSGANWRDVARLQVSPAQREFVADTSYYLALCCYGKEWHPLAIYADEQVVGFMMWAVDPADNSCWLGGILIDQRFQKQGYGRRAVRAAMRMLTQENGYRHFALSYQPANVVAKHLYRALGFTETEEWEDDEVVARLILPA